MKHTTPFTYMVQLFDFSHIIYKYLHAILQFLNPEWHVSGLTAYFDFSHRYPFFH